jgi:hypothetical protein
MLLPRRILLIFPDANRLSAVHESRSQPVLAAVVSHFDVMGLHFVTGT